MLLQGSQNPRKQTSTIPVRPEQSNTRPEATPPPTAFVTHRNYAPITWETPSLGRSVATGLGGIGRTVVLVMLAGAMLIGVAMAVAIVVGVVVRAMGFDPPAIY